jgi:hypothetical protein
MPARQIPVRRPRWYLVPVRILAVTFLVTVLSFAVSLLLSIIGLLIVGGLAGKRPDMTHAYRHMALPFAVLVALAALAAATVIEVRRYRQDKTLASIERLG